MFHYHLVILVLSDYPTSCILKPLILHNFYYYYWSIELLLLLFYTKRKNIKIRGKAKPWLSSMSKNKRASLYFRRNFLNLPKYTVSMRCETFYTFLAYYVVWSLQLWRWRNLSSLAFRNVLRVVYVVNENCDQNLGLPILLCPIHFLLYRLSCSNLKYWTFVD